MGSIGAIMYDLWSKVLVIPYEFTAQSDLMGKDRVDFESESINTALDTHTANLSKPSSQNNWLCERERRVPIN